MSARDNPLPVHARSPLSATARWALVLPAALLAPLGMWLLLVLTNLISGFIGEGTAHPRWIQIVGSAFLGYYFVLAGAKTAPSKRAPVAIVLATVLDSSIVGLYVWMRMRSIPIDGSFWWAIIGSLVTFGGSVFACGKVYLDSESEGQQTPGLKQTLAILAVSVIVASSILAVIIAKLPAISPPKVATQMDRISPRDKVREGLAALVERTNQEIVRKPFSLENCPKLDAGNACMELIRTDLRNDLGIDRYYRVHARVNLDEDSKARQAWAHIVGQNEFSFGFYGEREQFCRGETIQLMRDYGLRIGIIYQTVGGIEITRGIIDLAACLDFQEQAEASEAKDKKD